MISGRVEGGEDERGCEGRRGVGKRVRVQERV